MSSNLSHIEAQIRNYIPARPLGHPDNCDAGCCGAHSYLTALVNIAKAAEGLRRPAGRVYCNGGDETCEDCVGSCGIEEWIEFREALAALHKAGEQ
jgi:hypothetical protein